MIAFAWLHCVALMLVLDPDTLNTATVDGLLLVPNARLNPVQLPETDQANVCGNVMVDPADGLFNVEAQPTTSENDRYVARG